MHTHGVVTSPERFRPVVRARRVLARIPLGLMAPLILAIAVVACGGTPTQSTTQSTTGQPTAAPMISPGANLYSNYCARCHGVALEGKGSNPKIDTVRLASLGDQRLRMTIESGKGQMPGFRFSSTETDALLAYLRQPT